MDESLTRQIKIHCPQHHSTFDIAAGPKIVCEIREHALSNDFPTGEFWEYCCDCQTFTPGSFGTGGKVKNACPHCERSTARRFLCGECKTVSYDSDEDTKGKIVRVSGDKGIAPHCPGCGKSAAAPIHQHNCTDIEGALLTSRQNCPFCQKSIVNQPAPANVFSTEATATKSAVKSASTQCPKCGNWRIAERPHCGKCGTRINNFGDGVTPGKLKFELKT